MDQGAAEGGSYRHSTRMRALDCHGRQKVELNHFPLLRAAGQEKVCPEIGPLPDYQGKQLCDEARHLHLARSSEADLYRMERECRKQVVARLAGSAPGNLSASQMDRDTLVAVLSIMPCLQESRS